MDVVKSPSDSQERIGDLAECAADSQVSLASSLRHPLTPFVSWVGSKRKLIPQIKPHLPAEYDRFIEPFLGAGSLFLHLAPSRAILNDACVPLMETWRAIRDDPEGVYREATKRSLDRESYYLARSEQGGDRVERAGRFIYLNKGAFNGLYRVNLKGHFNVPWGAPKSGFICNLDNLIAIGQWLDKNQIVLNDGDFDAVIGVAGVGDFVFVDPPYVTSHNNNGFIEYNERIFSWSDQLRLAETARRAVDNGATVIVANAHHDQVVSLYPGFELFVLERATTLAAAKSKRGRTKEVLLIGMGDH